MRTENLTILQIMRDVDDVKLRIPDFQRDIIWSPNQVESLLESIYKNYPIGSFLIWRTKDSLRERNPLGLRNYEASSVKNLEKDYLLDGQQRTITLYSVFKNILRLGRRHPEEYRAYFDLVGEEFSLSKKNDIDSGKVRINPNQLALDEVIKFNTKLGSITLDFETSRRLAQSDPKKFEILNKLFRQFSLPVINAIYVENSDFATACEIFERTNTSGTPLGIVDIMVAKTYSKSPLFNLRDKLDEVNTSFAQNGFELDNLTILECVAACINGGVSRNDIEKSADHLRTKWNECISALKKALDFLKNQNLVPVSKFLPNEVILAPLTYCFFKKSRPARNELLQLEKFFWRVSISQRYIEGQNSKVKQDIQTIEEILKGRPTPVFPLTLSTEEIKSQEIRFGSAFCKSILCLFANKGPKEFDTGQLVNLVNSFASVNEKQLHHIFPRNYLKNRLGKRKNYESKIKPCINSIANISAVSTAFNQQIHDRAPKDYFGAIEAQNPNLQETLKTHLISEAAYLALKNNNFTKFLELRAKEIKRNLEDKMR